jgi:hypothetical protein
MGEDVTLVATGVDEGGFYTQPRRRDGGTEVGVHMEDAFWAILRVSDVHLHHGYHTVRWFNTYPIATYHAITNKRSTMWDIKV